MSSLKKENAKLISIRSYLIARGFRPSDIPAMIVFAKPKKVATKEEWDKIFQGY